MCMKVEDTDHIQTIFAATAKIQIKRRVGHWGTIVGRLISQCLNSHNYDGFPERAIALPAAGLRLHYCCNLMTSTAHITANPNESLQISRQTLPIPVVHAELSIGKSHHQVLNMINSTCSAQSRNTTTVSHCETPKFP